MNRPDDYSYYRRRADRERAAQASDPAIAGVHRRLAAEYKRRCRLTARAGSQAHGDAMQTRQTGAAPL